MQHVDCLEKLFSDREHQSKDGVILLKKLFFLMHHGELRINGQLPNREYLLGDYFVDGYRLMVDWSALSPENQRRLKRWLIVEQNGAVKTRFSGPVRIDETSGRPEESRLSWWGWFTNSTFFKRRYYTWSLPHDLLSTRFELQSIEHCIARIGALFEFKEKFQFTDQDISPVCREYKNSHSKRSVKRLLLNNDIIEKLKDFTTFDFSKTVRSKHPMSIRVLNPRLRKDRMKDHRGNHRYDRGSTFVSFIRHWASLLKRWFLKDHWIFSLFKASKEPAPYRDFSPFVDGKDFCVELDRRTGEVFVRERRPKFDTYVLCGGGARIYGHLGAIEEFAKHNIHAENFAGSSAGAIMGMMLYLGYSPSEIKMLFQWFRQENLLEYSVQFSGLSTANKLKQALDWAIYNKLLCEIERFKEQFDSEEGKAFLRQWIYPPNKITFEVLHRFKEFCPKSSLKRSLLVTATHKKTEQTHYFSYKESPKHEVSEAVTASASLPVVYHPRGEYIDGGVMNNLPLNYFQQDESTLLEHELRANFKVMAFQFDTGCEHDVLFSARRVFREGYFLNALYSFLTGVANPADAWMLERRHLRRYASQSVIIDVEGVKVSRFDVDKETSDYMMRRGRQASNDYIKAHFSEKDGVYHRDEAMYQTFENLEELILYAKRRRHFSLMSKLETSIKNDKALPQREALLTLIKTIQNEERSRLTEVIKKDARRSVWPSKNNVQKYCNKWLQRTEKSRLYPLKLFQMLFPVLAQDWTAILPKKKSRERLQNQGLEAFVEQLKEIRNSLSIDAPIRACQRLSALLDKQEGPTHLLVYLLKWAMSDVSIESIDKNGARMTKLAYAFNSPIWQENHANKHYFANWQGYELSDELCEDLLDLMLEGGDLTCAFVNAIKGRQLTRDKANPFVLSMPLSKTCAPIPNEASSGQTFAL